MNGHADKIDNGLYHASTSAAPLDPAQAFAQLATYKHGDGLSMSELIDSRTHGGLTYNGESLLRTTQALTRVAEAY